MSGAPPLGSCMTGLQRDIDLLERAASVLGDICDEVVLVGATTIVLWVTDPAAPPLRSTGDVDFVVEVATRADYYAFEDRLRSQGFGQDVSTRTICRWRHAASGLVIDAMPTRGDILGFENPWHAAGFDEAPLRALPSGASIRALAPPYLLAAKLEAFGNRGHADYLGSSDFADVVVLLDARAELVAEVAASPGDLRDYTATQLAAMITDARAINGLHGAMAPDAASQARVGGVLLPRMRLIIDSA